MSYKLADGTLSTDYKCGDKFKVVKNEHSCSETTVGEIVILSVDDYTGNPYFIAEDGSGSGERVCYWEELEKYEESSLPTYTQEQLSEIDELRDRIEYLQDLCSDYAKIIEEKDAEIADLRDNLLQVSTGDQFKPISEMTIEDWQQALEEGWLFEDNEEDTCQVVGVDKEMHLIEFYEYLGKFDIQGDYVGGHSYYITKRIK